MNEISSGSCLMADFRITGCDPSGSVAKVLLVTVFGNFLEHKNAPDHTFKTNRRLQKISDMIQNGSLYGTEKSQLYPRQLRINLQLFVCNASDPESYINVSQTVRRN